jgi:DNA-binding CsgD family transcriptional regulator
MPILHREQELAAVAEELARAEQGQPVVLVIAGAHGTGKTTLLQAALERVHGVPVILQARCHEAEKDFPFGAVRQLFDAAAGPADRPGPEQHVDAAFAGPGPGQEQDLHMLYRAARSLAASKSLIIAVDDFNFADPQSAQWFSYIARRLDGLPVSMILAGDIDQGDGAKVAAELQSLPYYREVGLSPLCWQCSQTLVATVFAKPVDVEFAAACHRLASGNPLVLLEMCRRLQGAGVVPVTGQAGRVAEIGAVALWETVSSGLRLRQRSTVELIECLAILGPGADLDTAAILAGHGEFAILDARELLGRAGLLASEPPGRFAQPHLPAAIVARMDPDRRSALHGKAAELLSRFGAPPADVAAHVMSVSPIGVSGHVQVLRAAAQEATSARNWPEAARYLRRALAETADPELACSISADLGAVEMHGDVPSSLRYLRAVADQAREPRQAAALAPFAQFALTMNSAVAGQAFSQACARLIAAGPQPADRVALLRLTTQTLLSGYHVNVRPALRMLSGTGPDQPAHADPRPAEELRGTLAIAAAARGRGRRRAVRWARHDADLGQARQDGGWLPAPGSALVLAWADLLDEAAAHASRQVTLAEGRGSAAELAVAHLTMAEITYRRGALAASFDAAKAAQGSAAVASAAGLHVAASALAARALLEQGDQDAAAVELDGTGSAGKAHHMIMGLRLYVRGRIEVSRGRVGDGLELFTSAGHALSVHGVTNPACLDWRERAVLACARLGQHARARELAAEAVTAARAWGAPAAIGRALAAAGAAALAAAGAAPPGSGLSLLREAAAALDGTGARLEQARVQVRLGNALHAADADRTAREALRQGLDLATTCGAAGLAAQARDGLLAAGARPKAAASFRPSPLTAGERRVTELVLQGLTNQEVAVKLCVSKRTVDTHLAHVYRKLGIRSRSRLREAMVAARDHGPLAPATAASGP